MARRTRVQPTKRDMKVLRYVRSHYRSYRCAPTRAEIAEHLGISRPTAEQHLQALQQCRLVQLRTQWRGIFLVEAR